MHRFELLRDWQRRLNERGWAAIAWPREYGGFEATPTQQAIFYEEMARARAPQIVNGIGIGMAGPIIINCGTRAQKSRYLENILTAKEIWCQGFSEPGAGSDLANIRTSAVPTGADFVVNGQKVWTSFAQYADWCLLMARTSSGLKRHDGLTCLLVDMHSAGIDVRPLRQMTGESEFNEVFFTDVTVARQNVLGQVNGGWRVAMTILSYERGGFALAVAPRVMLGELVDLAQSVKRRGRPAIDDATIRERIGGLYVRVQAIWLNNCRALSDASRIPGPAGSISKLMWSETMKDLTDLAIDVLGPAGLLEAWEPVNQVRQWQRDHLRARANTIEAGTSEVMRNIIAERVLGLPTYKDRSDPKDGKDGLPIQ